MDSLFLVPVGAAAAWGLVLVLRKMQPPEGVPPLGPTPATPFPKLHPPTSPDAEAPGNLPRWGLLEFVLGLLIAVTVMVAAVHLIRPAEDSPELLLISSVGQLIAVVLVCVFIAFAHGQNVLSTLMPRVTWPRVLPRTAVLFLLGWPALIFFVAPLWTLLLEAVGQEAEPQHVVQMLAGSEDWRLWAAAVFSAVFVAAFVEEFAFRGLLYVGIRRVVGPAGAALATAFLFALVHVNLFAFLPLFALGWLLAEVYERTRSLAIPILFHAAFNTVTLVLVALVPEWVINGETPQTQPAGLLLGPWAWLW